MFELILFSITYFYVPITILDVRDTIVNKKDNVSVLMELIHYRGGETETNIYINVCLHVRVHRACIIMSGGGKCHEGNKMCVCM